MDNFEYSIQINDRDWAEFYQTAEECDLMQVSLASDEEVLFSDPEHEDPTHPTLRNKQKIIKVSLCPPQEEQQAVDPSKHKTYNWIVTNEDVMSGSEDEGDFGSVTKFLCQKDNSLFKVKLADPSMYIPIPTEVEEQCKLNQCTDISPTNDVNDYLVDQMRTLNKHRKEIPSNVAGPNIQRNTLPEIYNNIENTDSLNNTNPREGQSESLVSNTEGSAQLNSGGDSLKCEQQVTQIQQPINGLPDTGCDPDMATGEDDSSGCIHHDTLKHCESDSPNETSASLYNSVQETQEHLGQIKITNEIAQLQISGDSQESMKVLPESKPSTLIQFFHKPKECTEKSTQTDMPTEGVLHFSFTNSSKLQKNIPDFYTEKLNLGTPVFNRLTSTRIYNASPKGNQTVTSSHSPKSLLDRVLSFVSPSLPPPSAPPVDTAALTIPEMYDFFYNDISEVKSTDINSTTQSRHKEGIMYTPDMYEYFFTENNEGKKQTMMKEETRTRVKSNLDLGFVSDAETRANTGSEELCVPEAYEFFCTDGAEDQQSEGIVFGIKTFDAQKAAAALQSIMPEGLCRGRKGHTARATHQIILGNGKGSTGTHHNTSLARTGVSAPPVSPGKGEACLIMLAIASWALKSSDINSSDSWKAALLANLGAISAIHYLRRQTTEGLLGFSTDNGEVD
ncbi:uncharacterized protein LOC108696527 [Xenopus laevis]|nr:uncharacterized protein LOC108696527 [Xenopus laevis]